MTWPCQRFLWQVDILLVVFIREKEGLEWLQYIVFSFNYDIQINYDSHHSNNGEKAAKGCPNVVNRYDCY